MSLVNLTTLVLKLDIPPGVELTFILLCHGGLHSNGQPTDGNTGLNRSILGK